MSDPKRCPACKGRGYFRCECWPGDCICGEGDETCFECEGSGIDDRDYEYDYPDHLDDATTQEPTR